MKNNKHDLLSINPVENYAAPNIPTLSEASGNPTLLKKLPSRWQKNAKVIACIGLAGTLTLAGFSNPYARNPGEYNGEYVAEYRGYSEAELVFRLHGGGGGSAWYVVHITEQEAFGIIRSQLEAAGLNFSATPPEYVVDFNRETAEEWERWLPTIEIDLFDEDKGVGISHISWSDNNIPFFSHGGNRLANEVAEKFAEQTDDIKIGAFFTPSWGTADIPVSGWCWETEEWVEAPSPTAEQIAEAKATARPILEEQIAAQVNMFVDLLYYEGILTPTQIPDEVSVLLNGTPIEFDVPPIIIDNRVMVPMRAIFEALRFEVEWIEETQEIVASRFGRILDMRIGDTKIILSEDPRLIRPVAAPRTIELDVPPQIVDNRTLVPLRAIVEATGANIRWNAVTQTVSIINQ